MKKMRMSKRLLSAVLALALIVTACFQYGFGTKAAAEAGTPVDVDVKQVLSGHSGNQLSIQLSAGDYTSWTILGDSHEEYSYWSDIQVYTSDTEYSSLKDVALNGDDYYYNLCGSGRDISFNMQGVENTAVKIVIPAGTVFPSMAYTGARGTSWGLQAVAPSSTIMNGYRVTRDTILTRPDAHNAKWAEQDIYSWNIEYGAYEKEKENVTLDNVHFRWDGSAYNLLLMQSSHDHASALANTVITDTDRLAQYNTLDYITFTKADNTEITLRKCFSGTAHYNIWGEGSKPVSYKLKDFAQADYITKITVKAGCELPSYAFTSGATSIQKTYVVTKDTVFTNNEAARDDGFYTSFTKTETKPERDTTEVSVNKLTIGENGNIIKFVLSDSDYDAAGNTYIVGSTHTEYNYLEKIKLFVNDQDIYYLKDGNIGGQVYYNMFVDNENSFSFECQQDIKNATVKIEIPAGTVFPSAAYTGATQYDAFGDGIIEQTEYGLGGFKTTKTVTFVKPKSGNEWILQADESVPTDITNIHIRRNGESDDYRLMFLLTESDFSTVTSNTEINAAKIEAYNLLDSVFLYDADGNEYKLRDVKTDKYYYTSFNEANSIGIGIDPTLPVIVQVKAVAGTEFPQYAYTHDGADKHAYYIENDNIFTVTSLPEQGNSWNVAWTKEEVLPLEEITTKITNIYIRDNANPALVLFTDVNDYAAIPTEDEEIKDTAKLEKYNTLDNILLETAAGTRYTLREIYTDNTYKPTYNIWETTGSVAYRLSVSEVITKVTIKAGCQLPSYAFTNGTPESQIAYVVENDTTFTMNDGRTDNDWSVNWTREEILPLKEVETTVTNLHIRHDPGTGYHMLFFLNNNDYESEQECDKLGAYELLDKVTLYTTSGKSFKLSEVSENDSSFKKWGEPKSFSVKLKDGLDVIKKVVIKSGAQFPSQAFKNGTADAKIAYTTTRDIALVPNGSVPADNKETTHWIEEPILPTETISTDISTINIRVGKLLLIPTVHDYDGAPGTTPVKNSLVHYNTTDKIVLYKGNESAKLSEVIDWTDGPYYNIWTEKGKLGIALKSGWDGTTINKVVIQAGCQIPSYQYTNGTNPTKDVYYTVPKELTFTTTNLTEENFDWNKELVREEAPTDITNIHIRTGKVDYDENVTELLLFLSLNDYGTDSNQLVDSTKLLKYQYADKIRLTATDGTVMLLKDVLQEKAHYNVWGEKGSIAFRFSTEETISKVEVLEGCELPSKGYTNGTADSRLTYVVPETITFMSNDTSQGNNWSISWTKTASVEAVNEATRVTNVHVRTGDNLRLLLFLSENDYQTSEAPVNVNRLAMYNTLENIILYTTDGAVHTLRDVYDSVATYNIWNEKGSIALQLKNTIGTIEKVYIRNGCELPSREYTEADAPSERKTYVVEEDTLFTVSTTPADNSHTVHWNRINPRTTNTTVKSIGFENGLLRFILGVSDYGNAELEMGAKHSDYNYLSTIRVYTSDTEYLTLGDAMKTGKAYFSENNTVKVTIDGSTPIRIVVPAWTVFPAKAYVNGTNAEMAGYEISDEKIFEFVDGTWKDVSINITRVYGDANGDTKLSSLDLVRMKKYFRDGYGMNRFGNCDDDATVNENDIVLLRKSMVGSYTLHPYVKESADLTYFMSQDRDMDLFLNDYFKRHTGYSDYVEGDMTATTYRPGEAFEGMFNTQWVMEASTWYSSDGFNYDVAESLKEWLEMVPVDQYGYVWDGNDIVEEPNTDLAYAKHAMGWPLPNANDANTDTSDLSVYWDFNDGFNTSNNRELGCVWDSNISATASNGMYTGTASGMPEVCFEVKDNAAWDIFETSIVQTEYAPWLAIDLRMMMDDLSTIDDIYVWYTTSRSESYSTTKRISVKDTAPIWYDMTGTSYEHMLYVPMYTQDGWYSGDGTSAVTGASDIYKIKIQIVPKSKKTLTGTFALNYVRPSFDTRYSNNNALFISTIKEYYDATGDTQFLKEYITKARKAMNFLMQMYDEDKNLNKQSYLFGHYGSTTELYDGIVNGYWDVTYTPIYDFQSNLYFYEALRDLSYLEQALAEAEITVSESAAVKTATIDGLGSSEYTYAGQLDAMKSDVLTAIRSTFWSGTRFVAGKDNSENVADNGHVVWNLQAIESGIATEEQADAIMSWIDGEKDMYQFGLAPMTNTIDNETSNMYSSFYPHTLMSENGIGDFGQNVQNGGAVMYSSYYDLMSRLQVNGTEDAYKRLTAIRDWYLPIANAYDYQTEEAKDFYYNYFNEQGKADYYLQNGSREGCGNGIIGLDGEFPESLLTVAAIPYGFFGVDSISASCLRISPSLPKDLQHWKIENMEFNNVKYDVSIFHGVTRIDGVDGDTSGLTVQIAMDYTTGQSVYVNGVKTEDFTTVGGKAVVTVDFENVVVEVR